MIQWHHRHWDVAPEITNPRRRDGNNSRLRGRLQRAHGGKEGGHGAGADEWVVDGWHHKAPKFWGSSDGGDDEVDGAVADEEGRRDRGGVFGVSGVDGEVAGDGGGGDASGVEEGHELGGGADHWGVLVCY